MCQPSSLVDIQATIVQIQPLSADVSILSLDCPAIAKTAKPGNFVNIKVNSATQPLLRRPFSIHNVRESIIEIMVKSIGIGTALLCNTSAGSTVMVLGPLGNSFDVTSKPFHTAVLVSGGIGTAPMLFLEQTLTAHGKTVVNLVGGRTKNDLLTHNLSNYHSATDDGSTGFKGTVIDLLEHKLPELLANGEIKIFACGPYQMLKALAQFCHQHHLACDLSLESMMGCGIGICYGCSVTLHASDGVTKNILLCREGAVIDAESFVE